MLGLCFHPLLHLCDWLLTKRPISSDRICSFWLSTLVSMQPDCSNLISSLLHWPKTKHCVFMWHSYVTRTTTVHQTLIVWLVFTTYLKGSPLTVPNKIKNALGSVRILFCVFWWLQWRALFPIVDITFNMLKNCLNNPYIMNPIELV